MKSIEKNGMYFISGIKEIILSVGGEFNDPKERPIVALLQSVENENIYWAIPVGDYSHRTESQIERIESYINRPADDIGSCYYHIARTNIKSIFFISDVYPINSSLISREYFSNDSQHYIIKNKPLLSALDSKLKRVLAYEQARLKSDNKFYFRQNIFGILNSLITKSKEEISNGN
ncbi:MAG: hypothetical protein LBR83_06335 [Clostridiales bacterium]|jgi:hypothetical protein|nr:hypothetical protein [Clostridiales bacterium]